VAEFRLSTQSKFIILTAVLASLLEIVDTSIVNVAIPTMMGNLGATLEDISWVVTGYIIANAVVLPLSGWLGVRIGRRKYYVSCILIFTIASVCCGLAPNLLVLTIFRIIQGLAGGALLPTSQTLIQEQFPRERAGMGSAIYGMSIMIGPTLGPTLGGFLTDNYGWRSIFNINLPLGLLAIFLALMYVEEPPHVQDFNEKNKHNLPAKKPMDALGLGLLATGIGCLQYVLERGQADDWFDSVAIRICSVLAGLAIPTFIWWELKIENPIVNLRLFKDAVVRNGTLLMMALGVMLFGLVFILPIFVNRTLHYDATQTGMLFIPGALVTAFCMPFVGAMLRKVDPRYLILVGVFIVESCLLLMTQFSSLSGEREIFWALLVRGLGMAFLFVPINTAVLGQFRGESLGQVAGLLNLFRQLGGSIGIALIGTLLDQRNRQNYIDVVSHVSRLNPMTNLALYQSQAGMNAKFGGEVGFASNNTAALRAMAYRVQEQVFMLSFCQMMWVLLIIFGFSLIPLYFLKVAKKIEGPVDAH
jgi:DHA2 family multidrug resistance protein